MAVRDYELVVVLKPTADDEAVTAAADRLKQLVADRGGSIVDEERWGLRRLAYPVADFREGHYVLTRLQLDGSQARGLEAAVKLQEDIIRHLLVRLEV